MTYQLLYLIGNGFDLKMGLKTKYSQFYQWYKALPKSQNKIVQAFRDDIDMETQGELWSDLEWALGQYLKRLNSPEQAKDLFNDIQFNLQKYIRQQNDANTFRDFSTSPSFMKNFFEPDSIFRSATRKKINEYFNHITNHIQTRIVIFNYTDTLEKLIGWKSKTQNYKFSENFDRIILGIEHIHGFCDDRGRLAIGVNSAEQISNPTLREDQGVIERFVKPAFNDSFELEHHLDCYRWISQSNIIVIYGMSLGKTDQYWWDAIANKLINNDSCILIVHFKRDCSFEGNGGPEYQEQIRKDRQLIIEHLEIIEKLANVKDIQSRQAKLKNISNRIFPTFSDELFRLPIPAQTIGRKFL